MTNTPNDAEIQIIHERQNGDPIRPKGARVVTVPVIYTLADGREVQATHSGLTRDDAEDLVAQLPRDVDLWFNARDFERLIAEQETCA
jgi:hypothetical protein